MLLLPYLLQYVSDRPEWTPIDPNGPTSGLCGPCVDVAEKLAWETSIYPTPNLIDLKVRIQS